MNTQTHIKRYLGNYFLVKGYKQIAVQKIASDLGISKKTFYKYFLSKEELIKEILLDMTSEAYESVVKILSSKSPFVEKYSQIFGIVEKHIGVFNDKSLKLLKNKYPVIWWKIIRFRKRKVLPLLRVLLDYSKRKKIISNYDSRFLIEIAYSVINQALIKAEGNKKVNKEEIFIHTYQILLNGVLTKKGKRFLNSKLVFNN